MNLRAAAMVASIAFLVTASGCVVRPFSSLFDHTRQIYDDYGPPPASLVPPKGFKVSPTEAYRIVTGGRPRKFGLYIYADATHYYLVDHAPLLVPTSGYARKYGFKIDGVSGICSNCPSAAARPSVNADAGRAER